MATQIEELEEQLFKTTTDAIKMSETVEQLKRSTIVAEACSDLAQTQAEKLESLVQELDFDDEESFAAKVVTVKESYFSKVTTVTEEVQEDESAEPLSEQVETTPMMDRYLKAIRVTNPQ
jgi:phage shock protein A